MGSPQGRDPRSSPSSTSTGYKPRLAQDYTIAVNSVTYAGTGNAVIGATITPTNADTDGNGQPLTYNVTITNPAAAQAAANGGKAGWALASPRAGFCVHHRDQACFRTCATTAYGIPAAPISIPCSPMTATGAKPKSPSK